MKTVAICDDALEVLVDLQRMIKSNYQEAIEVRLFKEPEELLTQLRGNELKADILFMAIKLEGGNGIEVACQIEKISPNTQIIFITAYIDYAQEIFRAEPIYLLMKPIQEEKLKQAMEKALYKLDETNPSFITLRTQRSILRLDVEQIFFVESDRRILWVYEEAKHRRVYMKLDEFMCSAANKFLRTHKSYAVNMDKITYFSSDGILLCNGCKVPVSRPRFKEAKERFLRYSEKKCNHTHPGISSQSGTHIL